MKGRIELHPHAYHVATADGAYILGYPGPVRLTGGSIAQWLDRLVPHLDGQYTVDELTAHLAPERRAMVEQIITTLSDAGLVRERTEPDPLALATARLRETTALVVGAGPLLPAIVRAARRSGMREVRVATTGDTASLSEPELTALVASAGLVLRIEPAGDSPATRLVERCCARAGVPLAQVVAGEGEAWLVPLADPGTPRWSALAPRLRPGPAAPAEPSAPAAVASQLVQAAFRTMTGIDPPSEPGAVIRVDARTLRSRDHRVLPHPYEMPAAARREDEFAAAVAALTSGERLTEESFSRRAARLVDDRFGIVTLHEHDWAQSPLHVTQARAYDPVGLFAPRRYAATTRAGFGHRAVRCGATMRALVHYGELMVDPRRLVDTSGRPLVAAGADPHQALAALRQGGLIGIAWGCEVGFAGRVRPVPAGAAFPRLLTATAQPDRIAGLAAGFSWDEAVLAGLLGHCRRLALAGIAEAARPYPSVDLATVPLEGAGGACRDLLADVGELPEVYRISDQLGVPAYGFCAGDTTIAYATGRTAASAIAGGLVQVVRWVQARIHGQPEIVPPAVPELPGRLRGQPAKLDSRSWDVATVAGWLRERGLVTVAVPLDHDPGVAEVLPYLVNVVVLG